MTKWHILLKKKEQKKREEKMNFDSLMTLEPVTEVRKGVAGKKEL